MGTIESKQALDAYQRHCWFLRRFIMNGFTINWIWIIGLVSEFDYRVMELCFDGPDAVLSAESIITGDRVTIMIVDEGKAIVVHYDADMERFDEMENVLYRHFANL